VQIRFENIRYISEVCNLNITTMRTSYITCWN